MRPILYGFNEGSIEISLLARSIAVFDFHQIATTDIRWSIEDAML